MRLQTAMQYIFYMIILCGIEANTQSSSRVSTLINWFFGTSIEARWDNVKLRDNMHQIDLVANPLTKENLTEEELSKTSNLISKLNNALDTKEVIHIGEVHETIHPFKPLYKRIRTISMSTVKSISKYRRQTIYHLYIDLDVDDKLIPWIESGYGQYRPVMINQMQR